MFYSVVSSFFRLFKSMLGVKLLLVCWLWSCAGAAALYGTEVVIAATADLHGRQLQLQRRIAPLIAEMRQRSPERFIYVDIGDTVQGTLRLQRSRGLGLLPLLAGAGCELWVPGNHEIEYGFDSFKAVIADFPGTVLAANLHAPELQTAVVPWVIKEFKQYKIAFIGLMLKDMNNCFPVAEARFQTLPGRAVLRRAVNGARAAGADAIVLLRHVGKYGGGENLNWLLKNIPEIDLVIGAHTHLPEPGCRIGNAWYVQPPAHGTGVLEAVLSFDDKTRQLAQIGSRIITLPAVREVPDKEEQSPVGAWKIKTLDMPALCMKKFTRSDLALYAVSSAEKLSELLTADQVRKRDCFRCFTYFDPVITVEVSGGEFTQIMREYIAFARKRKQFIAGAGFKYTAAGTRLQNIVFEQPKTTYTLALSAYAAAGAGGQLPGVRRILKNKINHAQAEKAPSILDVILKIQESEQ